MINLREYSSIEDAMNYIIRLLPEPTIRGIAAIVKYARIDDSNVEIRAVKIANAFECRWNLEITVGIVE